MRIIRKLFFFSLFILLSWLGIYAYNRVTDGFSIGQMTSSLPPCPQFEVTLSPEQKECLQAMLDQPFRYIGKGCQFYVFASADNQFVIKFLKQKHLRSFSWLKSVPMPQKLRNLSDAKIERRKERVERLFTSCKLAYEKMPEETGLLFIHLNRIPALSKQIVLIDKIGCKHTIELDDYEYVIQKKGVLVRDVFANVTEPEVIGKVQLLVDLVLNRCQKGICDRDRSFVQNVAFTPEGDRALFIDIGQFYEDPTMSCEEQQAHDLTKRLGNLRFWTERHFPQLAPHIP